MRKRFVALMLVIVMGVVLTACGAANSNKDTGKETNSGVNADTNMNTDDANTNTDEAENSNTDSDGAQNDKETDNGAGIDNGAESANSTQAMVDAILAKVEQPSLMDVTSDLLKDMYYLDPALLEQFTIKMPMMNVKTNEIAVLKVKDAKDIEAVKEAVKKRAADVQMLFETYLQDQYENAKNYKLVVKDNYVLFVISESADDIVNVFNSLFE